jgi:hypothetical protein
MVLVVWAVAMAGVLMTAMDTRAGPVLFTISPRHGVHLGDVLVLLAAAAIAAVLTWLLIRKPSREHRRSDVNTSMRDTSGASLARRLAGLLK